jgi:hypothetical protein
MLGFYSIRKLVEAKKLSNAVADQEIQVVAFPSLGKPITHMNWHKFDELYDQDSGQSLNKSLTFLCNQFVHSYIFLPVFDDDRRLSHVIVASDFERNRFSYEVDLNRVIDLFEQIGADYPNYARCTFNPKTNDYDVWQGMGTDRFEGEDMPL